MPKEGNNMDNKSYEQLLIMQDTIEANMKYSDDKTKNTTEYLKAMTTSTITSMMDHINIFKFSIYQKDSPKAQGPNTVFPAYRRASPLDVVHYTKIVACGISNMISDYQNSMTPHQDRTKNRNFYQPQELLQPNQYVSQYGNLFIIHVFDVQFFLDMIEKRNISNPPFFY